MTKEKILQKCEEKHQGMKETEQKPCDRFSDIKEANSFSAGLSANNARNSQSIANCPPNHSFLWTKANNSTSSDSNQSEKPEDVYDDVKNCPTYSEIRHDDVYDDIKRTYATVSKSSKDLTRSEKKRHIFNSADHLDTYDDVESVKKTMNERNETFALPDLVTATPAVILEDGFDSLSVVYDDIKRAADEVTLYESIAGSLLRLDNLEVMFVVAIRELHCCCKLAKIINEVSHKMPANNCCVERSHF